MLLSVPTPPQDQTEAGFSREHMLAGLFLFLSDFTPFQVFQQGHPSVRHEHTVPGLNPAFEVLDLSPQVADQSTLRCHRPFRKKNTAPDLQILFTTHLRVLLGLTGLQTVATRSRPGCGRNDHWNN